MERFKKILFVTGKLCSEWSLKFLKASGISFLLALGVLGTLDIIESRQRKKH